ncbi:MAG: 5'-deoxynucleotidase [Lachnospiraceae bacterium]|nr:5'-deoxynucleotidase [Lachnospiraceae bacterium]MBO4668700.1 5'-deoxynucleotidase [Lachnospiraceae bacterium]
MGSHFFAMISRMKYIERWALMRNSEKENISEHSLEVAMIAHALAVLGNRRLGKSYDADRAALIGIYHDANEIITGDMPTPVKYYSNEMQTLFHGIEDRAAESLIRMLPEDMRDVYEGIFFPAGDDEPLRRLVKAADKISALIKCIEESKAGNREFDHARKTIEASIERMDVPEADLFLSEFLPSYEKTLDEISR